MKRVHLAHAHQNIPTSDVLGECGKEAEAITVALSEFIPVFSVISISHFVFLPVRFSIFYCQVYIYQKWVHHTG